MRIGRSRLLVRPYHVRYTGPLMRRFSQQAFFGLAALTFALKCFDASQRLEAALIVGDIPEAEKQTLRSFEAVTWVSSIRSLPEYH